MFARKTGGSGTISHLLKLLVGEEKKEEKCKLEPFKYCPKVVNNFVFVFVPLFCILFFFAKVAKVEPIVKCEHHHHH